MSTLVDLPVFGLVLTLGAYLFAFWLHQRTGRPGTGWPGSTGRPRSRSYRSRRRHARCSPTANSA